MATVYKGVLRSKRKNELAEIANALGLRIDEESAKRDELEQLVKSHLLEHRSSLAGHPAWVGLYHSIDQSDKRAARSSSIALSPDSEAEDSPRKHTQKAKAIANGLSTPLRKSSSSAASTAVEGASNITSALQASTRRSIENLSSVFKAGASDIRNEVRGEINDAASEVNSLWLRMRRSTRLTINRAQTQGKRSLHRAQLYLSDSSNLTALVLILEASLMVTSLMPTTSVGVGQRSVKNFIKSGGKTASGVVPHMSVSVPNLWALLSYSFWRPIVLWTAWTVAIPLLAAHVITFERKHEPSAVTFNLTRLALLSMLVKTSFSSSPAVPHVVGVVAGEVRQAGASWFGSLQSQAAALVSYDFVAPFVNADLQVLLTTLAFAFSAYEVVAHRPRASTHA